MISAKSKPQTAVITKPGNKRMLALLIAAHNEEMVLEATLRSAINAGMNPQDIYVVDDNSSDSTKKLAVSVLGRANVCKVGRSGKGVALSKASHIFNLTIRYRWIHIADADGGFAPNYFEVFRGELRPENAAATGYVRSLPGGPVSQYRVFEYTLGMEIHRRFQSIIHTISVIPGPTSCFRSDIFDKVNFANHSLTEDFDVTLQIHRQKLGNIQFIRGAVAYTQDPKSIKDFTKQITRWNRGVAQGIRRHRIGLRPQKIDVYLTYQLLQNFMFFANYFILIPYFTFVRHIPNVAAVTFLIDTFIMFNLTLLVVSKARRFDALSAFPHIYALRFLQLAVFLKAFVEVLVLRRFKTTEGTWTTKGRRYKSALVN